MTDKNFNGYKNYYTWLYYTYITDERCSYEYWIEKALEINHYVKELSNIPDYRILYEIQYRLARLMEKDLSEWIADTFPKSNLLSALTTAASFDIDFDEVAESILEDALDRD